MKAGVSLYILSSPFRTSRGIHCIALTFSVTVLRYQNQKQLKKKVYSAYSFRGLESKRQGRHGRAGARNRNSLVTFPPHTGSRQSQREV